VRIAVDTNVLVRYLTWDDEGQAIEAARAIEGADAIVVPTIVLCELVWVLKRAHRYTGRELIDILRRFVAIRAVEIDRPAAEAGLRCLRAAATLPKVSSGKKRTGRIAVGSSR
jgi:predicted nucleic-acid-binding protein